MSPRSKVAAVLAIAAVAAVGLGALVRKRLPAQRDLTVELTLAGPPPAALTVFFARSSITFTSARTASVYLSSAAETKRFAIPCDSRYLRIDTRSAVALSRIAVRHEGVAYVLGESSWNAAIIGQQGLAAAELNLGTLTLTPAGDGGYVVLPLPELAAGVHRQRVIPVIVGTLAGLLLVALSFWRRILDGLVWLASRHPWPSAAVSLALPLAVSLLANHFDLNIILWAGHHIADGHFNVYEHVRATDPHYLSALTYPPLAYLTFGALVAVGRLFGAFQHGDWSVPQALVTGDYLVVRVFYALVLAAFASLAARFYRRFIAQDSATAERTRLVFMAALTCPPLLFISFTFGQFDLIVATLLLAGLYGLATERVVLGVLALVAGILFKNAPLLLLVLALPVILGHFGARRTALAVAVGAAFTAAVMLPFRGPALAESYLALQHHDYGVFTFANEFGSVTARLHLYGIGLCALASCYLAFFTNDLPLWKKLVALYAAGFGILLGSIYWMPQYMGWFAPALLLFVLVSARLESALAPAFYLGFGALYLVSTFVLFPNNVDSMMFAGLGPADVPPLAAAVEIGNRDFIWTALSFLILFMAGWVVRMCLVKRESLQAASLRLSPEHQLAATWVASLFLYLLYTGLHVINVVVYGSQVGA